MRYLRPLTLKDKYFAAIERETQAVFDDLIYKPIAAILGMRMREIQNSGSALLDAVRMGFVWYSDGQFQGRFSASISREIMAMGAKFNKRTRTYFINIGDIPSDVKFAQATADARYNDMKNKIVSHLDSVTLQTPAIVDRMQASYAASIDKMETDLRKIIAIEVALTDAQRDAIAKDWSQNLDLYIKKWTSENILRLREEIQPHVLAGGRAQGLIKKIQENYGVSQRKAKFLARQETALLMSKFQETRYKDIGIKRFKWSTSMDSRVRHDHKELQGKIFDFDSPPVVDRSTGRRALPGQDYNCRCQIIPIVD